MKYKTYKSVEKDYQKGSITQDEALTYMLEINKFNKLKRETKKLVNRLNQAAGNAGFIKPNKK